MKKLLFSLMILVLFISCGTKNAADNNAKTSGEIEKIQKKLLQNYALLAYNIAVPKKEGGLGASLTYVVGEYNRPQKI